MDEEYLRQEIIERYINGKLSESERLDFEKKLVNDPGLAKDLRFAQSFRELEGKEDELAFRENLSSIINEIKKESETETMKGEKANSLPERKTKWIFANNYRIAATVAVFISIVTILFFLIKSAGNKEERLFAQYFEPYSADFIPRSENDSLSFLNRAFTAYNKGDYTTAMEFFEKNLSSFPDNEITLFFLGMALIAEKEYPMAEAYLSKLTDNDSGNFYEQAQWYLALIALKTGKDRQILINVFRKIAESGKYKSDEAARIVAGLQ